ncbi:MAG: enoyl-CoA hydratase/isomerase family protein, partial [Shimia sp.]
ISMPEVAIGLVPDVGGSLLLAHAPGRMGEYLALTTTRMTGPDAIWCGFADTFVMEDTWDELKTALCAEGDIAAIEGTTPEPPLAEQRADIDDHFAGETLGDILRFLRHRDHPALAKIEAHSPLAMACAVEMVHRMRGTDDITRALELEYRFTSRALEHGDFIEGIRAMVIDKDKAPKWKHGLDEVGLGHVSKMLRPLGPNRLNLEDPA